MTCSIPDCSKPTAARGLCGAHYRRARLYGDPLGGRTEHGEPEQILQIVLGIKEDRCVVWPRNRNDAGYGMIWRNKKPAYVHRLVCEHVHGPAPSEKHEAAHSCGNGHRGCVAPAHLSWKTTAGNHADKLRHGTHQRGERHGGAKLTQADVRAIRALGVKGVALRLIAQQFRITRAAACGIIKRRTWGWMPDYPPALAAMVATPEGKFLVDAWAGIPDHGKAVVLAVVQSLSASEVNRAVSA